MVLDLRTPSVDGAAIKTPIVESETTVCLQLAHFLDDRQTAVTFFIMKYYACVVACWALLAVVGRATPAKIEGLEQTQEIGDVNDREPRLFFQFFTITPDSCTTNINTQGICYSATDCKNLGGTASGSCAVGFGVCCTFSRSCESSTNVSQTLFQNPGYPAATTTVLDACRLKVYPVNSNICQIRLDLTDFSFPQPDIEGECVTDFLQVIGGVTNTPLICGENFGQHLYVDVSPDFGSVTINVVASAPGAKWNISVTQIECNSENRAPAGCLQYFTNTKGTIKSFNYDATTFPNSTPPTATTQLASQVYGVCIKPQSGFCSVSYKKTSGLVNDYTFSTTGDASIYPPGDPLPGKAGSADCTTDYLMILGGTITDANYVVISADRYCGFNFPSKVETSVQPFVLYVVTDAQETTYADSQLIDGPNVGFSVDYRMQAC
ncbi:uncharacterized protein LOC108672680 [Hyalella azteca]|uniref:Uncharacterized protein LOC108672680 n=1 Tax=Hyalella azteca TaxID=294128 RepID=A0A8B7NS47_HYAAZ|nr:uncharacterized protein LOC108672680 [Hyalella azteca]